MPLGWLATRASYEAVMATPTCWRKDSNQMPNLWWWDEPWYCTQHKLQRATLYPEAHSPKSTLIPVFLGEPLTPLMPFRSLGSITSSWLLALTLTLTLGPSDPSPLLGQRVDHEPREADSLARSNGSVRDSRLSCHADLSGV